MLAEFAEFLHALDRLLQLVRLYVLQFVDEKAFVIRLRKEKQCEPHVFAAWRVQAEPGQVLQATIANRAVGDRSRSSGGIFRICSTGNGSWVRNVFDGSRADLKTKPNCILC